MFNSNGFYDIPHTLFNCTENMGSLLAAQVAGGSFRKLN